MDRLRRAVEILSVLLLGAAVAGLVSLYIAIVAGMGLYPTGPAPSWIDIWVTWSSVAAGGCGLLGALLILAEDAI